MEKVVNRALSRDSLKRFNRELREVRICCRKCKKAFPLSYVEAGNPKTIVFGNINFKCERCSREKYVDVITEGTLLRNVAAWGAVYI